MSRLRVGVAGMGIGQAHLLAYLSLSDLFEVVAIAEPDPARRDRAQRDWGVEHAVPDVPHLLELDLDVIDLCTPPWLHEEQILTALAADLHVVCEKPLVGSLAAWDRVQAAAARSRGSIMPIFQYRFGTGIARLAALVRAELTGPLHLATVETLWNRGSDYFVNPWRGRWQTEGGGCVLSHAVHNHDLLTHLAGPVRSITARTTTSIHPVETEDGAAALVEIGPEGALGTLSVTLGAVEESSRLRFCFANLSAESAHTPYEPGTSPFTIEFRTPEVAAAAEEIWADVAPVAPGYVGQLTAYHAARSTDSELPVTLGDARRSLELVTAWYASARSGRAETLPLPPDHPDHDSWLPPEFR